MPIFECDPVIEVWGGVGKNKRTTTVGRPWTSEGIILGSDINTVTSSSDIRGIEFVADKVDFPNPGKVYKIIGLGRIKTDGKQIISHGAYIQKSVSNQEWAYLFVYTGTEGEERIATAPHTQFHDNSSFDIENSDLAGQLRETSDNNSHNRRIFGRIYPNDKIATVINPITHKFEIYINGLLRYRSNIVADYHTGLRPVATFYNHLANNTVHESRFIRASQMKFNTDVKPNTLVDSYLSIQFTEITLAKNIACQLLNKIKQTSTDPDGPMTIARAVLNTVK